MTERNSGDAGEAGSTGLPRELVGYVWVDSGQLILTDPSYLEDLDPEMVESATTLKKRFGLIMEGMAVVFRSGVRNSRYPVYVTRFENGAIAKIEIEMAEQLTP